MDTTEGNAPSFWTLELLFTEGGKYDYYSLAIIPILFNRKRRASLLIGGWLTAALARFADDI